MPRVRRGRQSRVGERRDTFRRAGLSREALSPLHGGAVCAAVEETRRGGRLTLLAGVDMLVGCGEAESIARDSSSSKMCATRSPTVTDAIDRARQEAAKDLKR